MPKKIIIIGAGVAGLAAGCYAQMNDFQSEPVNDILQQHLVAAPVAAPDGLDDLASGEDLAWPAHQQVRQTELQVGQADVDIIRVHKTSQLQG